MWIRLWLSTVKVEMQLFLVRKSGENIPGLILMGKKMTIITLVYD